MSKRVCRPFRDFMNNVFLYSSVFLSSLSNLGSCCQPFFDIWKLNFSSTTETILATSSYASLFKSICISSFDNSECGFTNISSRSFRYSTKFTILMCERCYMIPHIWRRGIFSGKTICEKGKNSVLPSK